ncbi:helix-turn-helix domain-containing protein [Magnetospirillum sp. XM-1]|uniref:helix-turn-helix domain-containing protein n=1 Tax=Magnetospirillum sp. XM-1 TaxID=1663591 RepID=UPI0009EB5F99
MADELLTQDEVAGILRCSSDHVYRLRRSGLLPYLPGRPVKILRSDLEEFIRCQRSTQAPSSGSTARAFGKSLGQKAGAANAQALGRRIALSRSRCSPAS